MIDLVSRMQLLSGLLNKGKSAVCTRGETLHNAAARVFGPDAYPDMYDEENPERYIGVVSENKIGPCYGVFLHRSEKK